MVGFIAHKPLILRRQNPLDNLVRVTLVFVVMLAVGKWDHQFPVAYVKFNLCEKRTEHLNAKPVCTDVSNFFWFLGCRVGRKRRRLRAGISLRYYNQHKKKKK